jgi:hypothetical protein
MRSPTVWLFKIVFPASRTIAWYLNPSGACPKELNDSVAAATSDTSIFFILRFIRSLFLLVLV